MNLLLRPAEPSVRLPMPLTRRRRRVAEEIRGTDDDEVIVVFAIQRRNPK